MSSDILSYPIWAHSWGSHFHSDLSSLENLPKTDPYISGDGPVPSHSLCNAILNEHQHIPDNLLKMIGPTHEDAATAHAHFSKKLADMFEKTAEKTERASRNFSPTRTEETLRAFLSSTPDGQWKHAVKELDQDAHDVTEKTHRLTDSVLNTADNGDPESVSKSADHNHAAAAVKSIAAHDELEKNYREAAEANHKFSTSLQHFQNVVIYTSKIANSGDLASAETVKHLTEKFLSPDAVSMHQESQGLLEAIKAVVISTFAITKKALLDAPAVAGELASKIVGQGGGLNPILSGLATAASTAKGMDIGVQASAAVKNNTDIVHNISPFAGETQDTSSAFDHLVKQINPDNYSPLPPETPSLQDPSTYAHNAFVLDKHAKELADADLGCPNFKPLVYALTETAQAHRNVVSAMLKPA